MIRLNVNLCHEDVIFLYNNSLRSNSFLKQSSPYKNYPSLLYYEILKMLQYNNIDIKKLLNNTSNNYLELHYDDVISLNHLMRETINKTKYIYKCVIKYKKSYWLNKILLSVSYRQDCCFKIDVWLEYDRFIGNDRMYK